MFEAQEVEFDVWNVSSKNNAWIFQKVIEY